MERFFLDTVEQIVRVGENAAAEFLNFLLCRVPYLSRQRTGLKNRRSLIRSSAWPIFFPRIDDSHFDRIDSSLTAVHCFDSGYVVNQPVAWKEYYAEYWFKEVQESMDRCTGRRDMTEILLKTSLKHHLIDQS